MAEKTPKELFLESISKVVNADTNDLIQSSKIIPDNGILVFHQFRTPIDELKNVLRLLTIDILNVLPDDRFSLLNQKVTPLISSILVINSIQKDPTQNDHEQTLQRSNKFMEQYNLEKEEIWKLIYEAVTLFTFKRQSSIESKRQLEELELILESANSSKRKLDEAIVSFKTEFESIINSAKDELAKGGVGKHSELFISQASIHGKRANNWRIWFIILFIFNFIDIVFTVVLLVFSDNEAIKTNRIEIGILGLALASLISYLVSVCIKNYYAEKHNQTINQHKANCLGTFNTFVDAADPDRKAAILLQATQTIFSHQKSGFITKETESSSPSPIVEILSKIPAR